MSEQERYKVILDGNLLPDAERDQVIRELCELFHASVSTIERLLSGNEVALKKEYPKEEAEEICSAILSIGAGCRIMSVRELEPAVSPDGETNRPIKDDMDDDMQIDAALDREGSQDEEVNELEEPTFVFERERSGQARNRSNGFSRQEFTRFVGPNAEYYARKFARMGTLREPRLRLGWHWPAFFAFFLWAVYRKMWFWAGWHLAGAMLVMSLAPPFIIWILYSIAWPLVANSLYFRHFCHHVRQARDNSSGDQGVSYLSNKGGVSKSALLVAMAISILFSMYSSNQMMDEFVRQYENLYGPIAGENAVIEQMRGDGTLLENLGSADSPLFRTSQVLASLATSLKVMITAANARLSPESLEQIVTGIRDQDLKDGWGNAILAERELEHIVLFSLGPDGLPRTDDDVIHRIAY